MRRFAGSIVAVLCGIISALLVLRIVLLLLAARPDLPFRAIVLHLSWPLAAPLAWLDLLALASNDGARLDVAALGALVLFVLGASGVYWTSARQRVASQHEDAYAKSQRTHRQGGRQSDIG